MMRAYPQFVHNGRAFFIAAKLKPATIHEENAHIRATEAPKQAMNG